jgi:hypothetical protein
VVIQQRLRIGILRRSDARSWIRPGNSPPRCPKVSLGFAVLRSRLFDIDIVINRTLVYGSLSVMLGLVYLGGVAMTQGSHISG